MATGGLRALCDAGIACALSLIAAFRQVELDMNSAGCTTDGGCGDFGCRLAAACRWQSAWERVRWHRP